MLTMTEIVTTKPLTFILSNNNPAVMEMPFYLLSIAVHTPDPG